jgi:hypothetical protein
VAVEQEREPTITVTRAELATALTQIEITFKNVSLDPIDGIIRVPDINADDLANVLFEIASRDPGSLT